MKKESPFSFFGNLFKKEANDKNHYTALPNGIPEVTEDTINSIRSEYSRKAEGVSYGQYLEQVKNDVFFNQPHLADFMAILIGKYPELMQNILLEASITIVALVDKQQKSEILNEGMRSSKRFGIQIISRDIIDSIILNFYDKENAPWGTYLEKYKNKINNEQPHLMEFMNEQFGHYPQYMHQPILEVSLGTLLAIDMQMNRN